MSKKLRRSTSRKSRGNLPALRDERVDLLKQVHRMRDLLRERRDQGKNNPDVVAEFTAEEEGQWDKINRRLDSVDQQIEVEKRAVRIETSLDAIDPDDY